MYSCVAVAFDYTGHAHYPIEARWRHKGVVAHVHNGSPNGTGGVRAQADSETHVRQAARALRRLGADRG